MGCGMWVNILCQISADLCVCVIQYGIGIDTTRELVCL